MQLSELVWNRNLCNGLDFLNILLVYFNVQRILCLLVDSEHLLGVNELTLLQEDGCCLVDKQQKSLNWHQMCFQLDPHSGHNSLNHFNRICTRCNVFSLFFVSLSRSLFLSLFMFYLFLFLFCFSLLFVSLLATNLFSLFLKR